VRQQLTHQVLRCRSHLCVRITVQIAAADAAATTAAHFTTAATTARPTAASTYTSICAAASTPAIVTNATAAAVTAAASAVAITPVATVAAAGLPTHLLVKPLRPRRHFPLDDVLVREELVGASERRHPRQHLVQDAAEGPEV
jgi:hypothetical protein